VWCLKEKGRHVMIFLAAEFGQVVSAVLTAKLSKYVIIYFVVSTIGLNDTGYEI
jgi:hypothetical protein